MSPRPFKMRILICGDRFWDDSGTIIATLHNKFPEGGVGHTVIHGACKGADRQAGAVAKGLGFAVIPYPADWDKYGKAAGPIRNRVMLDTGPNLVIAFHNSIETSKGTKDCVEEAQRRGIPTEVVTSLPMLQDP